MDRRRQFRLAKLQDFREILASMLVPAEIQGDATAFARDHHARGEEFCSLATFFLFFG
ncbi:MAG: hypothetical protein U1A77_10265 [Pirellulales bacterium]